MNIKKKSKGTPEQMLEAFENKINELEGNASIESSVDVLGTYNYEDTIDLADWSDEEVAEYIYNNFENITNHSIEEIYNSPDLGEGPIFDQSIVDVTHDDIKNFVIEHSGWGKHRIDNFMYVVLDEYLSSHNPYSVESATTITSADAAIDADYLEKLCEYVTAELDDAGYEAVARVEGEYIVIESIYDVDSRYVQPIDDIEPNWDDLNDDAAELADAYMDEYPDPNYSSEDDEPEVEY